MSGSSYDLSKTTLTYSSSNPSVIEVNSNGTLGTAKKVGESTITITAAAYGPYKSATTSYKVYVSENPNKWTYDGSSTYLSGDQVRTVPDITMTLGGVVTCKDANERIWHNSNNYLTNDVEAYSSKDVAPQLSLATATADVYERMKNLPVRGSYFKFEPDADGTLTVDVAAIGTTTSVTPCLMDEEGLLVEATSATSGYDFKVKAGKSYFLFGSNARIGLRSFLFVGETTTATGITLTDGSLTNTISQYTGQLCDVTLKRAFAAGRWTSLVLPFSVSVKSLHDALGSDANDEVAIKDRTVKDVNGSTISSQSTLPSEYFMKDVSVLYFDGTEGSTLKLGKYFDQMILAGMPVFIKPQRTVDASEGVTFKNVRVGRIDSDGSSYTTTIQPNKQGTYTMTGSYESGSMPQYSYYMGYNSTTSKSQVKQYVGSDSKGVGITQAWIEGATSKQAKTISVSGIDLDWDDDNTTGIDTIMDDAQTATTAKAVYNLNGQLVSGSLDNLSKGVYVVAGKKIIVK